MYSVGYGDSEGLVALLHLHCAEYNKVKSWPVPYLL